MHLDENWQYFGSAAIALAGWRLYFQIYVRKISELYRWRNDIDKRFNELNLDIVRDYATKKEMERAFNKLDEHIEQVRESLDRLREKLERR